MANTSHGNPDMLTHHGKSMTATEAQQLKLDRAEFFETLANYVNQGDDLETALNLHRLCGKRWNDTVPAPDIYRWDVRDAIECQLDADQWEKSGRTISGAARRIRPKLNAAIQALRNFDAGEAA